MITLATSSQMRSAIHQTSADSAFFLRPHLTKEEYAYWTSHFRHFLHSCDKRTVTYQQREPSCCVRRTVKELPCRSERTPHPCCDPTVLGDRTCVRPVQSGNSWCRATSWRYYCEIPILNIFLSQHYHWCIKFLSWHKCFSTHLRPLKQSNANQAGNK